MLFRQRKQEMPTLRMNDKLLDLHLPLPSQIKVKMVENTLHWLPTLLCGGFNKRTTLLLTKRRGTKCYMFILTSLQQKVR